MAFSVGIDLVSREEVDEAMNVHGRRYLDRVYTEREIEETDGDPLRLAARFAAKEATMKALRRGDEALAWREIAVHRDSSGRPHLQLTGSASRLADARHVNDLAVSLTHEGELAAAVVLAHTGGDA